jgi:hypothetical protein
MSRRLMLCLIAGIGAAALPIGLFADGDIVIHTDGMSAGPGQIVSKQTTTIVNADGTVTPQSTATSSTPTTQPDAGATTQPSTGAPATQPDAAAPAPAPAGMPNIVVQRNGNGVTVTTTGGMAAGPGQITDTHITMTITPGGASNVTVQQSGNAAPPATQPADSNAPATQPAGNGG